MYIFRYGIVTSSVGSCGIDDSSTSWAFGFALVTLLFLLILVGNMISCRAMDHLLDGFVVSGLCRWSTTDASCRRWYKRDSILCDTLYLCSATQLGNLDVSLWTQMCRASPAGRQAASKVTVPVLSSDIGDVVIIGVIINVREASEESSFVRESRWCR